MSSHSYSKEDILKILYKHAYYQIIDDNIGTWKDNYAVRDSYYEKKDFKMVYMGYPHEVVSYKVIESSDIVSNDSITLARLFRLSPKTEIIQIMYHNSPSSSLEIFGRTMNKQNKLRFINAV